MNFAEKFRKKIYRKHTIKHVQQAKKAEEYLEKICTLVENDNLAYKTYKTIFSRALKSRLRKADYGKLEYFKQLFKKNSFTI